MNTKFLVGALAAGVLSFITGWLVYGMLLSGTFELHTNQCAAREMEEMIWWALIAFNLVWGAFIACIVSWSNATDFMAGFIKGAIVGFLISLTFDLQFYAFTNFFASKMVILIDVLVATGLTGLIAGLTAIVMSKVSS